MKSSRYKKHVNKRKTHKRKTHKRKHKGTKHKGTKHKWTKKIYKKNKKYTGGFDSSDGFILDVDEDGLPINNSLDYENAEIFIKKFLFTEEFIKTYLEQNKEDLVTLYSFTYLDYSKVYSGDKSKLITLIDSYIKTYPKLFLQIYGIIDPLSQKEYIKNLYKSDMGTVSPLINSPYRPEITVSSGGVKVPVAAAAAAASSDSYKFSSMPSLPSDLDEEMVDVPLNDDDDAIRPAPAAVAAESSPGIRGYIEVAPPSGEYVMPERKNKLQMFGLSILSLFKPKKLVNRERALLEPPAPAPAPAPPAYMPAPAPVAPAPAVIETQLSKHERRTVVTFNFVATVKQFICKITVIPHYLLNYTREFDVYQDLRQTLSTQGVDPSTRLENFFRWQTESVPFASPILVTLNLTYNTPVYKTINLVNQIQNLHMNVTNNVVPIVNNRLVWGSLNGVFNPLHVDFKNIITNTLIYNTINRNAAKIKTGLEFIFNNLYFFYIRTGFLHSDFKTDNILVETNNTLSAITNSYMFDLDISFQLPASMYIYNPSISILNNRKILDNTMISSGLNVYLKITSSLKPNTTTVSVGMLHFFDCYFAAHTLIADATNSGKLGLMDDVIKNIKWVTTDPYHSLNIFKLSYEFIRVAGITSTRKLGETWGYTRYDSIIDVMSPVNPAIKALFPSFSEQKKQVYRWVLDHLTK